MKFSWVITIDISDVHVTDQGQRPEVKVAEVNLGISGLWLWFKFADGNEMIHKGNETIHKEDVSYCFSRSSIKFQGHPGK